MTSLMRRRQTGPRRAGRRFAGPARGRREAPFTRAVYRAELRTAWIVVLVATVGLVAALVLWSAATDVDRNGVRTTGEVVDVFDPRRGPGEVWVRYQDQAGATYVHHQYVLAFPGSVGERVPVAYRADRPAEARATGWTPIWPVLVLLASCLVGGVGVATAVWARHEYSRQARERSVSALS